MWKYARSGPQLLINGAWTEIRTSGLRFRIIGRTIGMIPPMVKNLIRAHGHRYIPRLSDARVDYVVVCRNPPESRDNPRRVPHITEWDLYRILEASPLPYAKDYTLNISERNHG